MPKDSLKEYQIKIDRDKSFDFLGNQYLLVLKIRRYCKKTNLRHWMGKYPNLIKEIRLNVLGRFGWLVLLI